MQASALSQPDQEPLPPLEVHVHGLPMPRRLRAILSVSAGSVLYTLDANLATVALPTIARELGVTTVSAVLIVSIYNLVLAMVLLPLAAIGERIGHRRMFVAGLWLYVAAAVLCYAAQTLPLLVIARSLQALAAGAVLSVSLAMVREIYPPNQLGRGLGINTIMASSGAAIAPAIGGMILSLVSWHWVFTAGVPLACLGLLFASALPDSEPHKGRFDTAGAVLCAMTFGLVTIGFQKLAESDGAVFGGALLAAGALVAFVFVRHERSADVPVLPVDLLARPAMALSVAAALAAVLASAALMLYVPFRLTELGLDPAEIGGMLVPFAASIMLFGPLSGALSDRISPSVLGTVGLMIAVLAGIAIAFIPNDPEFFDVAWRLVLCGAGFGMFFSPNGRLIIGSAPRARAASASSLLSTTRMFGQALGSTLIGGLLALRLAPSAPALVATALTALACLLSAARLLIRDDRVPATA